MTRFSRSFRDGTLAFLLLAFLALLAAKFNQKQDNVHTGRFAAVDGDSLVMGDKRFRLKGIDAPEYRQICERNGRDWDCGKVAADALKGLLEQGAVTCRESERDQYHRMLAFCSAGNIDINAEMVRRGMAVSYGAYKREEDEARMQRIGLWAGTFARPRDYRDAERAPRFYDVQRAVSFLKDIVEF